MVEKTLGYCHNCACKVTAKNIGIMVVAQKDVWCDKQACKKSAKNWVKRFDKENCQPLLEKIMI